MPGIGVHDHGELMGIFETVAETGLPLMVHPHDQALMTHIEQGFWARGERDAHGVREGLCAPTTAIIWDTAAALLLRIQKATGTALHLLHTQTEGVVEQLRRPRRRARTCPPSSTHGRCSSATTGRTSSGSARTRSPTTCRRRTPSRSGTALADGTIDLISTDHAPHSARRRSPAGRTAGRPTRARRRPSSTCRCS